MQVRSNLCWEPLSAENFEETLQLILNTELSEPGNPLYLALQYSRAELDNELRPLLKERLRNGTLNMLFRVDGKAAAFAIVWDILDAASTTRQPTGNAKTRVKQRVDSDLMAPYMHLTTKRGEVACPLLGIAREFASREFLALFAAELVAYLHLMGYERLASVLYSPTLLYLHQTLLGGYLADELDRSVEHPDGSGRVIQPSKHLCFSLAFARLDEEHLASHLPDALVRAEELKSFEAHLVDPRPCL